MSTNPAFAVIGASATYPRDWSSPSNSSTVDPRRSSRTMRERGTAWVLPARSRNGTSSRRRSERAKIEASCREIGRDPATIGITALIGLWFSDLQEKKPRFFDNPLTGTVQEIAAAMRGYSELGVQHIMFQCEPYTPEARRRLTEALQLYRGMEQQ